MNRTRTCPRILASDCTDAVPFCTFPPHPPTPADPHHPGNGSNRRGRGEGWGATEDSAAAEKDPCRLTRDWSTVSLLQALQVSLFSSRARGRMTRLATCVAAVSQKLRVTRNKTAEIPARRSGNQDSLRARSSALHHRDPS